MGLVEIDNNELERHLIEQIELLETSCELYDSGKINEAKRIAVCIRTLFHDTRNSKSLLGQLQKKSNLFYSSNLPIAEESISSFFGLCMIGMKGNDSKYYPKLDEMTFSSQWLPFEEWWNEVIFRDKGFNKITRKSLITTTTNQDGGAHVDEKIDEIYYNLSRNNSLNISIIVDGIKNHIPQPDKAAIRQIGHEILKTFNPDYTKMQSAKVDVWLAGPEKVPGNRPSDVPKSKKIGRNESCPCGSGFKYKHCHGK
jgi:hypothetical protein